MNTTDTQDTAERIVATAHRFGPRATELIPVSVDVVWYTVRDCLPSLKADAQIALARAAQS